MSQHRPATQSQVLTLAGHAEQALREMIFSGELEPGERISADGIATRIGISASPVREALRGLISRGLVEAIPQRGFRVRPATLEDFAETYQLRLLLDPFATELAVPRMDQQSLDEMDDALGRLSDAILAGNTEDFETAHRAFHFAIYRRSGSRWLLSLQEMLWENSTRYRWLAVGRRGSAEERITEHRVIADACRLGESTAAAELVARHLKRTHAAVHDVLVDRSTSADRG